MIQALQKIKIRVTTRFSKTYGSGAENPTNSARRTATAKTNPHVKSAAAKPAPAALVSSLRLERSNMEIMEGTSGKVSHSTNSHNGSGRVGVASGLCLCHHPLPRNVNN